MRDPDPAAPGPEGLADALPLEPNGAIRQLDARDLPDELLAGAAVMAVRLLPASAERDALVSLLHARPGVVRVLRQREAARLIELLRSQGYGHQAARERAARAVGVSEWTIRVAWGL